MDTISKSIEKYMVIVFFVFFVLLVHVSISCHDVYAASPKIQSITFESEQDFTYMAEISEYNVYDDDYNLIGSLFNTPSFKTGDRIIATFTDGNIVTYTAQVDIVEDYYGEERISLIWETSDENYAIDYSDKPYIRDFQATKPWGIGKDENNYFIVGYKNCTCKVPVTIIENPIASISFKAGERQLLPEEHWIWVKWFDDGCSYYSCNTEVKNAICFPWVWSADGFDGEDMVDTEAQRLGDKIIVTRKDGSIIEYVYTREESGDEYFVDNSGNKLDFDKLDGFTILDWPNGVKSEVDKNKDLHLPVRYAGKTAYDTVSFADAEYMHSRIKAINLKSYSKTKNKNGEFYDGQIFVISWIDGTSTEYEYNSARGCFEDGVGNKLGIWNSDSFDDCDCEPYVYTNKSNGNIYVKYHNVSQLLVAKNTLKASGRTVRIKYKKVKKSSLKVKSSKAITVTKPNGKVTYQIVKKDKRAKGKISIKSNGTLNIKKGLRKGTYKIKVKVTAAGTSLYMPGSKTVTVTVKVR